MGLHFTLFKDEKDWNSANEHCKEMGGHLATYSSQEDADRIKALVNGAGVGYAWIGMSDLEAEGQWRFIDGDHSYCDDFDGTDCDNVPQWYPGEPNSHGDEDCAEMYSSGLLNDDVCTKAQPFVCEFASCQDMVIENGVPIYETPLDFPDTNPVGGQPLFKVDFASAEQGMLISALLASNMIAWAVAAYSCCGVKVRKAVYSKVAFSDDDKL